MCICVCVCTLAPNLCFLYLGIVYMAFPLHARFPGVLRFFQLNLIIHRHVHDNLPRWRPPLPSVHELWMQLKRRKYSMLVFLDTTSRLLPTIACQKFLLVTLWNRISSISALHAWPNYSIKRTVGATLCSNYSTVTPDWTSQLRSFDWISWDPCSGSSCNKNLQPHGHLRNSLDATGPGEQLRSNVLQHLRKLIPITQILTVTMGKQCCIVLWRGVSENVCVESASERL